MFGGDWTYGDPRESETVGQRRQRKAGVREGSIRTDSSAEKHHQHPPNRSITPSSFFTAGGNFKYPDAPNSKQKPPGTAANSSNCKKHHQSAALMLSKSSSEKAQRAASASAASIASSQKGKSVFGLFGKRPRHERTPSINEIVPRKALEMAEPKASGRVTSMPGEQSTAKPASEAGSYTKERGTINGNTSTSDHHPNHDAKGTKPTNTVSINRNNNNISSNNSGNVNVSDERFRRPPAPPPNVPIPPTPNGKQHGHAEQGSISDQSTLVMTNRRSDVPSEIADSPSRRRFVPSESPVDFSVFPMPRTSSNCRAIQDSTPGALQRNTSLHGANNNRQLAVDNTDDGDDGDDEVSGIKQARSVSPATMHTCYSRPSKRNDNNSSEIDAAFDTVSITDNNKYRNDMSSPYGSLHSSPAQPNRNSFVGSRAANSEYSRGPSRNGAESRNQGLDPPRQSFKQVFSKMEGAGLKIVFKRLTEDWSSSIAGGSIDDRMLEEIDFEKKIWAIIGNRWLTLGRLFVSPAQKLLSNAREYDCPRVLSLHGTQADGWVLAANFPEAMVYSISCQDMTRPVCSWAPPQNHHSVFMQMITPTLPFSDNYFDVITSKSITSLVSDSNWLPLLKECYRILRPGGWLEIQTVEPMLTKQGELLRRWTNSKLLLRLMENGYSPQPTEDIMERFSEAGFSDVKRSRIQLPAVPKRYHRSGGGGGPSSQRDLDGNKLMVFVGRHLYEDLYAGFVGGVHDPRPAEKMWWNNNRQIKTECEIKQSAFDMSTIFGQKL